jgi:hypothetical protein
MMITNAKIESDIEKPIKTGEFVAKMQVGDSVHFGKEIFALRLRDAMRYKGIKYTMRKIDNGWRVWRDS